MPSRREVLQGLVLSFAVPIVARAKSAAVANPSAFINIKPDNTITLLMPDTEFGQGVWTSAAMLIAEELEVPLSKVQLMPAPPDAALYATEIGGGEQATGGSTSMMGDWMRLREAGARARMMLIEAAAQVWNVDAAACVAANGMVHHRPSARHANYGGLSLIAAKLPVPATVKLKAKSDWKLIGTPQKRLDTPAKINGRAIFGIDVHVPGMKIGTVAACPVHGGTLASIDEKAARAVPGVRDIVLLPDAVAVIGDHFWAAKQGLKAANPQWHPGENADVTTAHIVQALAEASAKQGAVAKDVGDASGKIAASAKKLEAVYHLPFLSHAPMEPVNATLHVRPDGADIWVGTQVPVRARDAVAEVTGLSGDHVTVHNQLMGGAFGRRLEVDFIVLATKIAKHVAYPVKIIYSREEDIGRDMFRPMYYDTLSAGLDNTGKITGWTHRTAGSSVMARWAPAGMQGALDPDAVEGGANPPYDLPAMKVDFVRTEPRGVATAWWRGVGPTHNVTVVESFIDECAAAAGADPVAYRRAMLTKNKRALAVLNLVAEKSGWGSKLPARCGRGVSLQAAFGSYLAHVLEIEVPAKGDIILRRSTVAIDCGQRVNPDTVASQIEGGIIFGLTMALYSEITHENGRVQQSNFDNYRMLRINETPRIEVYQVESTEAPGGIGETGTAASAAALGNAIFAATGKRLRTLPFAGKGLQQV